MGSFTLLALVDYIHLLHKGKLDSALYHFYREELGNGSPMQVSIAIDNLIIRYKDIPNLEKTVARFIRAVSAGLDVYPTPVYVPGTIFHILEKENEAMRSSLEKLKHTYLKELANLESGNKSAKELLKLEIGKLDFFRTHYRRLQYGVFPVLESVNAPTLCAKLMWHLQDSVWSMRQECLRQLGSGDWDYNRFNKIYGQMYYLAGTLIYREGKILFPVACAVLPEKDQFALVREGDT